jgi:hypothetical protein
MSSEGPPANLYITGAECVRRESDPVYRIGNPACYRYTTNALLLKKGTMSGCDCVLATIKRSACKFYEPQLYKLVADYAGPPPLCHYSRHIEWFSAPNLGAHNACIQMCLFCGFENKWTWGSNAGLPCQGAEWKCQVGVNFRKYNGFGSYFGRLSS